MVKNSRGDRESVESALVVGLAYYLGQRHAGMTLRELGKYLGEVEYPAVSVAIARFQNRLKTERSLQRRVKQIEKLLKVEASLESRVFIRTREKCRSPGIGQARADTARL